MLLLFGGFRLVDGKGHKVLLGLVQGVGGKTDQLFVRPVLELQTQGHLCQVQLLPGEVQLLGGVSVEAYPGSPNFRPVHGMGSPNAATAGGIDSGQAQVFAPLVVGSVYGGKGDRISINNLKETNRYKPPI